MNLQNEPAKQDPLAAAIYELIEQFKRPRFAAEDELWTTEDIAIYFKLSVITVERRVVVQPEFPEAVQPCQTGQRATKRWFAGEVIRWAKKNRGTLPKARVRGSQSRREATSDAVAL